MELITERDNIKAAIRNFIRTHGKGTYRADKRGIAVGEELEKHFSSRGFDCSLYPTFSGMHRLNIRWD